MEENKENIPEEGSTIKPIQSEDLRKISAIEKSINNMKLHLNFLSKQDQVQQKKINLLYNTSLRMANNKLNLVSTHIFQKSLQGRKSDECETRKGMVKEMRQKKINQLKETRLQVSEMRQKQTRQLRQFSRKNDNIIKVLREEKKIQNIKKADKIRLQEKQKRQKQALEKQRKRKELEELQLKRKKEEKIKKKYLNAYMEDLRKKQEQLQDRIKEKKLAQMKMKQTMKAIPKIKDEEVLTMAKTCRKKIQHESPQERNNLIELDERSIVQKALQRQLLRLR